MAYCGQLDDSCPENQLPPDGKDLRTALDWLLTRQPVPNGQQPSIDCNIKWKQD